MVMVMTTKFFLFIFMVDVKVDCDNVQNRHPMWKKRAKNNMVMK